MREVLFEVRNKNTSQSTIGKSWQIYNFGKLDFLSSFRIFQCKLDFIFIFCIVWPRVLLTLTPVPLK